MRNVPPGSGISTLPSQLVVQFGEVEGLVGGRAWLKEACHWGWALRVWSLAPLLMDSLCFRFVAEGVISQLPASDTWCHASPAIRESPPEAQINSLFLSLPCSRYSVTATEK